MRKQTLLRSELIQRQENFENNHSNSIGAYLPTMPPPATMAWLDALITKLDEAKDNVKKVRETLAQAISNFHDVLDEIRFELAGIPVFSRFHTIKSNLRDTDGFRDYLQLRNYLGVFDVPSELCPIEVLPPGTQTLPNLVKEYQPVWCYYPVTLAKKIGLPIVKSWDKTDSIIDTFKKFVELDDPEAAINIEEYWETDDRKYTFYFRTTQIENIPAAIQHMDTENKIDNFIRRYGPVRVAEIKAYNPDIKEYALTRTLKRLEQNDQIEKIRHGVYIPVCS